MAQRMKQMTADDLNDLTHEVGAILTKFVQPVLGPQWEPDLYLLNDTLSAWLQDEGISFKDD